MEDDEQSQLLSPSTTPPNVAYLGRPPTNYSPLQSSGDGNESSQSVEQRSFSKSQDPKISARHPFLINSHVINRGTDDDHINTVAQYHRYRYYTKLHGHKDRIIIPDHVVPSYLFLPLPAFVKDVIAEGKQSSLITIFAIWNTMMGTSLLSMPWAITQSGLGLGIGIMVFMSAICLYTCLLILKSAKAMDDSAKHEAFEFSDVCYRYLGKWGKLTCIIFSIVALLGAAIVYWVLLSNFLFSAGKFIFDHTHSIHFSQNISSNHSVISAKVLCPSASGVADRIPSKLTPSDEGLFYHLWKKKMTVPFYLIVILLPLSCLKSPTFFTKFNALGTLSVFYMLIFITVKAVSWGINIYAETSARQRIFLVDWASWQFPSLSGTLGLALYIHNCILSITRNQVNPQHNTRDVCIAYFLASGTYLFMGVVSYLCFPLVKTCLEQVFLDNFPTSDVLTFTAQVFLLFQMITVFPLLLYIIRVQLLSLLFGKVFPGWIHVIVLNILVIGCGITFAVVYPHVGHIIRYVGSISGLVYIFGLPCIIHMAILYEKEQLTWLKAIFFSFIVVLGVINFILQFLVS